jgi:hypothetical protein
MGKIALRRYTNLAATIHILKSRSISLLSPNLWDDRNDTYFLNSYKERKSAKSVLALCFAEASETYHHWRVFSHGSDGVCIEFDKDKLLFTFASNDKVRSGLVNYRTIVDLMSDKTETDEFPFLKRYPYQDEREFRIVYTDCNQSVDFKEFGINLNAIDRIHLSPWMPLSLSKSVASALRSIEGCGSLKVSRSTLIENEKWKSAARR